MRYLVLLFFLSFSGFNIIERIASPFDDGADVYQEYFGSLDQHRKVKKAVDVGLFALIGLLVLFVPAGYRRRRWYRYYDDYYSVKRNSSLAYDFFETMVKIIQKPLEKKFFEVNPEIVFRREEEVKRLLAENNINYDELVGFVKRTVCEFFDFILNKHDSLDDIATQGFLNNIEEIKRKLPKFDDVEILSVSLVNFRYSVYEKAFSAYVRCKYNLRDNTIENGFFITFVDDGGFKISAFENEGESYVMKLENFFTADGRFAVINTEKFNKKDFEIRLAETFYKVYMWWMGKDDFLEKDIFLEQDLYRRFLSVRRSITTMPSTVFEISKIIISNVEVLNISEDVVNLRIRMIVRFVFIMKGRFIKNQIVYIDNEEKLCDEIWEFVPVGNRFLISDIDKKISKIESNPLQIEWHI